MAIGRVLMSAKPTVEGKLSRADQYDTLRRWPRSIVHFSSCGTHERAVAKCYIEMVPDSSVYHHSGIVIIHFSPVRWGEVREVGMGRVWPDLCINVKLARSRE